MKAAGKTVIVRHAPPGSRETRRLAFFRKLLYHTTTPTTTPKAKPTRTHNTNNTTDASATDSRCCRAIFLDDFAWRVWGCTFGHEGTTVAFFLTFIFPLTCTHISTHLHATETLHLHDRRSGSRCTPGTRRWAARPQTQRKRPRHVNLEVLCHEEGSLSLTTYQHHPHTHRLNQGSS